ncbi:MAG: GTPase HflX [Gammaproteobacteria bacterium]|nr:GTPase HflX [Gammaproteobacteria bacterium]
MFERPQTGERAVLVQVNFLSRIDEDQIEEFRELAVSAGAIPVASITCSRRSPEPKFLIGEAKATEIQAVLQQENADLVLVNHTLTPAQERNLERFLQCRVLDRTGLILDIFAQRATSHEGRLQVELAQLQHLSTRLVRGWTHLERQKGGIGLRGPGETQLETDRRLLGDRIKQLKKRLQKVRNSRGQGRRSRQKAEIPTVSLVGYTNAGKSTLFNRLTQSHVYAADQLFATLDPTLRRIELTNGDPVILADTVGFIRQLPHDLVEAFRSTLEETRQADLLLHVVDASDENYADNIQQVNSVLKEIDAQDIPQIEVFNKLDLIDKDLSPRIDRDPQGNVKRVWISAQKKLGLELLSQVLEEYFRSDLVKTWLRVDAGEGKARAKVYQIAKVIQEQHADNGNVLLEVVLEQKDLDMLLLQYGVIDIGYAQDSTGKLINYCG